MVAWSSRIGVFRGRLTWPTQTIEHGRWTFQYINNVCGSAVSEWFDVEIGGFPFERSLSAKEPFWSRSDGGFRHGRRSRAGSLCRELIQRRTTSHRRNDPPSLMISRTGVNALVSHLGPLASAGHLSACYEWRRFAATLSGIHFLVITAKNERQKWGGEKKKKIRFVTECNFLQGSGFFFSALQRGSGHKTPISTDSVLPETYETNIYYISTLRLVYITAGSTQGRYKLFISHYSFCAESLSWCSDAHELSSLPSTFLF